MGWKAFACIAQVGQVYGGQEFNRVAFRHYSLKPAKGSYLEKLMKEGKVKHLTKKDIEARKKKFKTE